MGKRKHVHTKLHSELSEYSSLLRALRTNNTLDLASQLTVPDAIGTQPTAVASNDVYEDDDDISIAGHPESPEDSQPLDAEVLATTDTGEPAVVHQPLESVASTSLHSRMKPKGKTRAPATVRDTWTKWPLVPSEVYVPEWSFDEEVRVLATEALQRLPLDGVDVDEPKHDPSVESEHDPEGGDESDDEEPVSQEAVEDDSSDVALDSMLSPTVLRSLTRSSARRLHEILAISCAMLPEGEDSLQNRHGYINWELILNAADALGLYRPEQLENIRQRMLVLYPKYQRRSARAPYFVDPKPPPRKDDLSFVTLDWYQYYQPGDLTRTDKNGNESADAPPMKRRKSQRAGSKAAGKQRQMSIDVDEDVDEDEWDES